MNPGNSITQIKNIAEVDGRYIDAIPLVYADSMGIFHSNIIPDEEEASVLERMVRFLTK